MKCYVGCMIKKRMVEFQRGCTRIKDLLCAKTSKIATFSEMVKKIRGVKLAEIAEFVRISKKRAPSSFGHEKIVGRMGVVTAYQERKLSAMFKALVKKFRRMVLEDCRLKLVEITTFIKISKERIHHIFHQDGP